MAKAHPTSAECLQTRKLLGWSIRDLRSHSLVSIDSISRHERGEGTAQPRTLRDLRLAFESAGIVFTGRVVRLGN